MCRKEVVTRRVDAQAPCCHLCSDFARCQCLGRYARGGGASASCQHARPPVLTGRVGIWSGRCVGRQAVTLRRAPTRTRRGRETSRASISSAAMALVCLHMQPVQQRVAVVISEESISGCCARLHPPASDSCRRRRASTSRTTLRADCARSRSSPALCF
jgi:hypothetical protein